MINKFAYLSHSSPRPKLTHSVADARNVAKKKMMVDNIFFIGSRCCILLYLLCHFGILVTYTGHPFFDTQG